MKVIIFSMPRCYTKSLQTLVSQALSPDQAQFTGPNGFHRGHLGELLQFNECTHMCMDDTTGRWVTYHSDLKNVSSYAPVKISTNEFSMQPTEHVEQVTLERINQTIEELSSVTSDWVLKVFPSKFRFHHKFEPKVCNDLMRRITRLADVVLPVMRLDVKARVSSEISSARYGRNSMDRNPDAKRLIPSDADIRFQTNSEIYFRELCLRFKMRPLWAEYLPINHERMLGNFGINTKGLTLPEHIEYSKLSTHAPDELFSKDFCEVLPRARMQDLRKDDVYRTLIDFRGTARSTAPGFLGIDANGVELWANEASRSAFVAAGSVADDLNALMALRVRQLGNRR